MKGKSSRPQRMVPRIRSRPVVFRAHLAPSSRKRHSINLDSSPLALDHELVVVPAQLAPPITDLPPDEPVDNLVLTKAYDDGNGISISFGSPNNPDLPVSVYGGDTLTLLIDGVEIQTVTLVPEDPGDPFSPLSPDPVLFTVPNDRLGPAGEYRSLSMRYRVVFFGGGDDVGPVQKLSVDNVPPAPGGSFPGKLSFDKDIEDYGITEESFVTDDDGNEYIEAHVPGYTGKKAGDIIHGYIDAALDPKEEDIGLVHFGGGISDPVDVRFPRDLIESAGDGVRTFQYDILARENQRSGLSAASIINVIIKDFIGDLDEPGVPAYDDDDAGEELIDEADARDNLTVNIPTNAKIQVGDSIELHWGALPVTQVRIEDPADIRIVLPYALVQAGWLAGNATGDDIEVPVEVSYDVWRNRTRVGTSPSHHVEVNLHTAGGVVDPDPGTEPNENLLAPVLRPKSGEANDDSIPFEDSGEDATVRIEKLGDNGELIFAEDDRVVVHYADEVLAAYTIVATDLDDTDEPLEIVLPWSVIDTVGAGTQELSYWIERDLANGGFNSVKSPIKDIVVETTDALPGGGTLVTAVMPEVTGSVIGLAALLDGTPIAIPDYKNFKETDVITLYVPVYPAAHGATETTIPGYGAADSDADQENRFVLPGPHVMLPAETGDVAEPGGPGAKPTRPPITVPHIFFRLPADRIPGLHGPVAFHTHVTYTISNAIGEVTSAARAVIIDPRGARADAPAGGIATSSASSKEDGLRSVLGMLKSLSTAIERLFR